MRWSFLVAALSLSVIASCGGSSGGGGGGGPPPPVVPPNLRPPNSPDVVVISVSGRCRLVCSPPKGNMPYLGVKGGAAEAVENVFKQLGNKTLFHDFISSFYSYPDGRRGFLGLVNTLQATYDDWIDGFTNPTRIVIVAHSHGCVWAHMATSVLPKVPIDYLISLDGNCFLWESTYPGEISSYFTQNGNPFPWDIRDACDRWRIPSITALQDTEDVVWPNVAVNLEVRSKRGSLGQDEQLNYRLDGSGRDIYTFTSTFDNHTQVHNPKRESMLWVLGQLALLKQ